MSCYTYDRNNKYYDEPHSPVSLEKMLSSKTINKGKFLSRQHAESYLDQMQVISSLSSVRSILEIGPGEGFCQKNLKSLDYYYDTLDSESIYNPTFCSDFRHFDASKCDNEYDLVCAFQVLEHFPYESFTFLINKMVCMSNKYLFISIPYSCFGIRLNFNIHFGQFTFCDKKIEYYFPSKKRNRKYRDQYVQEFPWAVHYWEVGRKGFDINMIINDIESCELKIVDKFHGSNPFHYFLLCERT